MTSQYIWQPLTILHDFVCVLGRPLKFFLGCFFDGHCSSFESVMLMALIGECLAFYVDRLP